MKTKSRKVRVKKSIDEKVKRERKDQERSEEGEVREG